jgi:hypothetical protein
MYVVEGADEAIELVAIDAQFTANLLLERDPETGKPRNKYENCKMKVEVTRGRGPKACASRTWPCSTSAESG